MPDTPSELVRVSSLKSEINKLVIGMCEDISLSLSLFLLGGRILWGWGWGDARAAEP